ncbi:hypothetical protein ACFWER_10765, partial [Streptomyces sp. NPDC060188]
MNSDGTQDARGTQAGPVPRPAGPPDGRQAPDMPAAPPRPARAPGLPPLPDGSEFVAWARAPRPDAAPG